MEDANRGPDRRKIERRSFLERRVKNLAVAVERRSGTDRRQGSDRRRGIDRRS